MKILLKNIFICSKKIFHWKIHISPYTVKQTNDKGLQ